MADSTATTTAIIDRLAGLIIQIGARRVRRDFAARIADPTTDPGERAQMRRLLVDHPENQP